MWRRSASLSAAPRTSRPRSGTCAESDFEIAAVISNRTVPGGRGQQISSSAVKETPARPGFPSINQQKSRRGKHKHSSGLFRARCLVIIAYGQIIPAAFSRFQARLDQSHASLLPKYRGGRAHSTGPSPTANRLRAHHHAIDAGMDTGDILLQKESKSHPPDRSRAAKNIPKSAHPLWRKLCAASPAANCLHGRKSTLKPRMRRY